MAEYTNNSFTNLSLKKKEIWKNAILAKVLMVKEDQV